MAETEALVNFFLIKRLKSTIKAVCPRCFPCSNSGSLHCKSVSAKKSDFLPNEEEEMEAALPHQFLHDKLCVALANESLSKVPWSKQPQGRASNNPAGGLELRCI